MPKPLVAMLTLAAAALSACSVLGPDHQRPASTLDAGFVAAGTSAVNAQAVSDEIAGFWRGFGDATLSALVERGLQANHDVRLAQARLQEARAVRRQTDADANPGLGIDGGVTRSVQPTTFVPGRSRSERTQTVFEAGFVANWELDFFGRFKRGSEAAAALVEAGAAGLGAAHTSVAAEVARHYLELRGLQQRRLVTQAALVNQRESLRIVQARLDAGRATRLDLARAQALVASTEAALPALQSAVELAVFRLATLTAQPPRALLAQLAEPAPLPGLPVTDLATLPVGTPEQWLQRRPDVIAAERQLAAATARIGIAKTDLFPRLSLSGLLGLNAGSIGSFAQSDSAIYSLGVGLTWTPFDLGTIRSRIAASEARAQASLASYEQTVLVALEETEGAFSGFNRLAERSARLAEAARASEQAAGLARLRFEAGVTDFLAVLDAERESLANRDQWVQAQTGTATALVAVYRALGGGWATPAATQARASGS